MLLILVLACRIKTEVPFDEPADTDTADTDAGDTDTADGDSDACVPTDELCNDIDDDCDGLVDEEDDSLTGAPTWYTDADGDGYGDATDPRAACAAPPGAVADSTDCDDADAETNPNATEVCDDLDNDCDSLVDGQDDSLVGASTWYADVDGDGYGDATDPQAACAAPPGAVADSTDCDDADAETNPDAIEVCDDLDNDCDSLVDGQDDSLVGSSTWYADADGDGYGDVGTAVSACHAPPGTLADSSDCDDTLSSVSPAADEVCDGADDDCDGLVDDDDPDRTGGSLWYTDADGDGYGDAASVQIACSAPPGAVSNGADWDDADAAVHERTPPSFSVSPSPWALAVDASEAVTVSYVCELDAATLTDATFEVYGDVSGFLRGTVTSSGATAEFVSDAPARAGERLTAVLSSAVLCADGSAAGAGTWTWMVDVSGGTGSLALESSGGSSANTWKIVPVDLDGDGILELVVSDRVSSAIEVYAPTDGMALTQTIAVSSDPIRIDAADVDHDFDPDIVVATYAGDLVETLLNDGTGVLTLGSDSVAVAAGAVSVDVGDVDLDGDVDVVVASQTADLVSVLLNDGSGSFTLASETATASAGPGDLLLADVDGDFDLDVVVVTLGGAMAEVLLNDGRGGLSVTWSMAVGSTALAAWAADLTGDGEVDVAVGTQYGGEIDILAGSGVGTFATTQVVSTHGVLDLCGADLDSDGDVDLAFAEHDGRQLRTLQNDGAGTFAAWVNESIGSYITGVACADVDGDGAVDVLMSEEYAGAVWYYGNVR